MVKVVEIELDGPHNENPIFRPIQQRLRGRFDLRRVIESKASERSKEIPEPVPGQQIGMDLDTGEGYVLEPLSLQEYAVIRKRIEEKSYSIPERLQSFASVHKPTWLFWMKRLVESGTAKLVKGEFPKDLGGEPRKSFYSAPESNREDKLTEAVNNMTKVMEALLTQLSKVT